LVRAPREAEADRPSLNKGAPGWLCAVEGREKSPLLSARPDVGLSEWERSEKKAFSGASGSSKLGLDSNQEWR
jgi:hypothetical protein